MNHISVETASLIQTIEWSNPLITKRLISMIAIHAKAWTKYFLFLSPFIAIKGKRF